LWVFCCGIRFNTQRIESGFLTISIFDFLSTQIISEEIGEGKRRSEEPMIETDFKMWVSEASQLDYWKQSEALD